jgi:hypothetical protein
MLWKCRDGFATPLGFLLQLAMRLTQSCLEMVMLYPREPFGNGATRANK